MSTWTSLDRLRKVTRDRQAYCWMAIIKDEPVFIAMPTKNGERFRQQIEQAIIELGIPDEAVAGVLERSETGQLVFVTRDDINAASRIFALLCGISDSDALLPSMQIVQMQEEKFVGTRYCVNHFEDVESTIWVQYGQRGWFILVCGEKPRLYIGTDKDRLKARVSADAHMDKTMIRGQLHLGDEKRVSLQSRQDGAVFTETLEQWKALTVATWPIFEDVSVHIPKSQQAA